MISRLNKKIFIDNLTWYSLIFIVISFPIDFRVSNLGIITLCFACLLNFVNNASNFQFSIKNEKGLLMSLFLFFICYVFAILFAENKIEASNMLSRKMAIILLPILVLTLKIEETKIHKLLNYYIYSLCVFTMVLLANSIASYFMKGKILLFHDFVELLNQHAIYYAYFLSLAIVLLHKQVVFGALRGWQLYLKSFCFAVLWTGLFFCSSKNVLITTIIATILLHFVELQKQKIKVKPVLVMIASFIILLLVSLQIDGFRNRITSVTNVSGIEVIHKMDEGLKLDNDDVNTLNGITVRWMMWKIGIEKLKEENQLLFGLNPGDSRSKINEKLEEYGLLYYYKDYDMHNQFIQVLVQLGIVGSLLFFFLNFTIINYAIKSKNYILLIFVICLIIFQMTESLLERNKGIVFAFFFISLLASLGKNANENRNIRN